VQPPLLVIALSTCAEQVTLKAHFEPRSLGTVTQVETLTLPSLYMQRLFTSVHYLLYLHHQRAFYQQTSDQILNRINQIIKTTDLVDTATIKNLEHSLWEIGGELLHLTREINHMSQ
jgi:hypothetical protein